MDPNVLIQIAYAVAALLVGLGLGLALRRPDRRLRTQLEEMREKLEEAERGAEQTTRERDVLQARVEAHFGRTSDLFRDLTERYTALYAHLAESARNLCPEGSSVLTGGLDDPLLAAGLAHTQTAERVGEEEEGVDGPDLEVDAADLAGALPDLETQPPRLADEGPDLPGAAAGEEAGDEERSAEKKSSAAA